MADVEIGIIDYGTNNLKSITKAVEKVGRTSRIIDDEKGVKESRCLILPGVGAFQDGMRGLRERRIVDVIQEFISKGNPMLGICLGMQMLFSESEEFGIHQGLNIVQGTVVPFQSPKKVKIEGYKVPQIGWNELSIPSWSRGKTRWDGTLLEDTEEGEDVYFVHSFYPKVQNPEEVLATCTYGEQEFCAVVKKGKICGTQFHPEKSGKIGLKMLDAFFRSNNL